VRSADPAWIRDVYRFAPVPHAIFYLKVDLEHLMPRVLARGGFDYWESGMDFQEETDIYVSYVRYQKRIISVFNELAQQYGMRQVDANGSIREVFDLLKSGVRDVVSTMRGARV
jgi:dTMP kinase